MLTSGTARYTLGVEIIPVIDLKDNCVVRGIAGQRAQYLPVVSQLGCDAGPASVAAAFVKQFAFTRCYIADLDALAGADPNWAAYAAIAEVGLDLLIDAGVASRQHATEVLLGAARQGACPGVIVALESLRRTSDLPAILETVGSRHAVFSLDLKHGLPLTTISEWQFASPQSIAEAAVEAGFRRLIVLDLASVGVGEGPSVERLCAEIRQRHPDVELISGGGVRGMEDLRLFHAAGCDAVLVASALHDGRLTPEQVKAAM